MNNVIANKEEWLIDQIKDRLRFYKNLLANMKVQSYLSNDPIDEIENKERILMYKRVIRKLDIKLIKAQEIVADNSNETKI